MAPSGARKRKRSDRDYVDDDTKQDDPFKRARDANRDVVASQKWVAYVDQTQTIQALKSDKLQNSALLRLPRKIRKLIWAHTFDYYDYVKYGRRIDITWMRPLSSIPVAATVCRKMMGEVLDVFLNEVNFVIWVDSCEGERDVETKAAYMRLCNLQRKIGKVKDVPKRYCDLRNSPKLSLSGGPFFREILKWAEDIHSSKLSLSYEFPGAQGHFKTLREMLQTAVVMRGSPWERVEKVLETMREVAVEDNYIWMAGM